MIATMLDTRCSALLGAAAFAAIAAAAAPAPAPAAPAPAAPAPAPAPVDERTHEEVLASFGLERWVMDDLRAKGNCMFSSLAAQYFG